MTIIETKIPGVLIIEPKVFKEVIFLKVIQNNVTKKRGLWLILYKIMKAVLPRA